MATLQDYLGITKLRDAWPKWKANIIAINIQLINHIAGTADKHTAQHITYTGLASGTEVKTALNSLKSDINNVAAGGAEHDALVTAALVDSEGIDFGAGGLGTYLDGRLNKWEVQTTAQLADNASYSIKDYGALTTNADNHSAIIQALDDCQLKGGGTVLVPIGVFKTSPLVLQGYSNIIIRGCSPSLPWETTSCLQFISIGAVGLQLSEVCGTGYVHEVPTWNNNEIVVDNLRLDGNNMVDVCVNGNYGITLKDVTTEHALKDGIVFEPQTYPFALDHVVSRLNGRHGLYIKAPYTTVYDIRNKCEFSSNDGYGIVIEDGNTCKIDALLQGNKQGGLRIELKNPNLFTHAVFLANLMFENLYTEANGTLLNTDPNFEGNCGVKILAYNKAPRVNLGKIAGLAFVNCTVNASIPIGFTSKAWEISGVQAITTVNTYIPSTAINYNECGSMGGFSSLVGDNSEFPVTNPTVTSIALCDTTRDIRAMVGHGYVGMRGRMRELHFYLPYASVVAGTTVLMKSVYPIDVLNHYPILQGGSLYGVNIYKRVKPTTGTLTFKIRYGYISSGVLETATMTMTELLQLDATKNNMRINFPLLKYLVSVGLVLGIEVTASADYVSGVSSWSDIVCELFVES